MRTAIALPTAEATGLSECLDRLSSRKNQNRPISTYRFQLNAGFRFEDARQLLPYLHALGVTHCYFSPILKARAGSMHGYDIIDHNTINPEIGTEEEFEHFVREMKALGMSLVLDIVPNHMGVGYGTNPWWQDVLENGQASRYAEFFDIDWEPLKQELHGKVLLPVLGDQYGEVLEKGELKLSFENGSFFLNYYDKRLPIDAQTYPIIFQQVGDLRDLSSDSEWQASSFPKLQDVLGRLRSLPPHTTSDPQQVADRQREIPSFKQQLSQLFESSAEFRSLIDELISKMNGRAGDARSFTPLHQLLEAQAYRLAHWRVSAEEINYRRFFDINDLIGVRMEHPEVFAETHKLIRKLLAEGSVEGIRLDHPDGLFNPVQYFTRLQMLYAASQCCGPAPQGRIADNGIEESVLGLLTQHDWMGSRAPLYVLVEKILEPGEHLPQHWAVDGTVGYEFGNLLNNLFINKRNQRAFTNFYHRFIGGAIDVDTLVYESKKLIMREALSSEVTVLTHMLADICSTDRRARDFTRNALLHAIQEVVACFPVYRTYVDERGNISDRDRGYIQEAIVRAKRRNQSTNPAMFDFLRSILLLQTDQTTTSAEQYRKRLQFTLKLQQLTGPVMAKGLEDTACYVYNRFISVNEVGGSPSAFGISVEEFHAGNLERARDWPYTMLGTSTHDSKRSEDVRARLNVISEMPRQWSASVIRWRRANKAKKRALGDGRTVPDANEEYLLYQTLLGAWPLAMDTNEESEEFLKRIQEYMTKALHEAKVNLSWTNPNQEYVDAMNGFIERILRPGTAKRPNTFLQQIQEVLRPVTYFGAINSLAQVLLKLTCPGVPDIYRGTELWDFSLVDPDNRRPVDYDLRQQMLGELLKTRNGDHSPAIVSELLDNWQDGRVKLWTILRGLRFRRDNPGLAQHGSYVALNANGEKQEHVVAFARQHEYHSAIVAVPRFAFSLMKGELRPPTGDTWGDTEISLPSQAGMEFQNALTGEIVTAKGGRLLCREVFASFPVALLNSR